MLLLLFCRHGGGGVVVVEVDVVATICAFSLRQFCHGREKSVKGHDPSALGGCLGRGTPVSIGAEG